MLLKWYEIIFKIIYIDLYKSVQGSHKGNKVIIFSNILKNLIYSQISILKQSFTYVFILAHSTKSFSSMPQNTLIFPL